jgi:peptide/nickel transport system substrate-binding protein
MSRRKVVFFSSIVLIVTVLLTACGPTTSVPAQPTQAGSSATTAPGATKAPEATKAPAATEKPVISDVPFRIAVLSDMTTRNVWDNYGPGASTWNAVVQNNYYPALYGQSVQRFDLAPFLAADWATVPVEEGGLWVSTVSLHQGVYWSDGSEVTADDVAWTINIALQFELSGNWGYVDAGLDHAEALDPYTVVLYYASRPGLAQHEYGAMLSPIVCKAFWEPLTADAVASLSSLADLSPDSDEYQAGLAEAQGMLYALPADGEPLLGPYNFSRWEVGAYIENTAYANYYWKDAVSELYADGAYREYKEGVYDFSAYGEAMGDLTLAYTTGPMMSGVLYTIYSQDAAVLALMNGDVDYVFNPNGYGPGLKAQLAQESNIALAQNPANMFRMLAYNFNSQPLDDAAVRQALDCMIDRDFLTQNLLQGTALTAYTAVPKELTFWSNAEIRPFCDGMTAEERLNWAVNHLKEAGYTWDVEPSWDAARGGSVVWGEGLKMPDGTPVQQLKLMAPSAGYDPLRATAGVFVEQWANQLGLPVKAELVNFNNIVAETIGGGGNWDMVISGWTLGDNFPDHVCVFFESDSQPFNFGYYNSPDLDALCDEFYAASTMEEAQPIVIEIQSILGEDLPYSIMFTTPVADAYRKDTVQFPTTDLLNGLYGLYGMQTYVKIMD